MIIELIITIILVIAAILNIVTTENKIKRLKDPKTYDFGDDDEDDNQLEEKDNKLRKEYSDRYINLYIYKNNSPKAKIDTNNKEKQVKIVLSNLNERGLIENEIKSILSDSPITISYVSKMKHGKGYKIYAIADNGNFYGITDEFDKSSGLFSNLKLGKKYTIEELGVTIK